MSTVILLAVPRVRVLSRVDHVWVSLVCVTGGSAVNCPLASSGDDAQIAGAVTETWEAKPERTLPREPA